MGKHAEQTRERAQATKSRLAGLARDVRGALASNVAVLVRHDTELLDLIEAEIAERVQEILKEFGR